MSANFKYPLQIKGTKEQLEGLVEGLKQLGYTGTPSGGWYEDYHLTTEHNVANGAIGWSSRGFPYRQRIEVDAANPELVLALAAVVNDKVLHVGEYVVRVEGSFIGMRTGDIAKVTERTGSGVRLDKFKGEHSEANLRKATREELEAHIKPTTEESTNLKAAPLPEKWYIAVTPGGVMEADVVAWFNKNATTGSTYAPHPRKLYYHFPAGKGPSWFHQGRDVADGYTEITYEQFKKQFMDKKIIGYKLKPGVDAKIAGKALDISELKDRGDRTVFGHNSLTYEKARSGGILDLIFDPVYEPDKPAEVNVTLKDGTTVARVTKNGSVFTPQGSTPISYVKELLQGLKDLQSKYKLGSYAVTINSLHVGCSDGYDVTLEDLKSVADAYDNLNK